MVTHSDQGGLNIFFHGDCEAHLTEISWQKRREAVKLIRTRADNHCYCACALPGDDPVFDAELGPQRVNQSDIGGLGDQIGDDRAKLFSERGVERLGTDHALREQDVAKPGLFAQLQGDGADKIVRVKIATFDKNFA
jgi:hypothetical protein